MAFTIKQGDTLPPLVAILREADLTPIDLSDATSVKLAIKGPVTWKKDCSIVDAPEGKVSYSWVSGDTSTNGQYEAEFEITWPGGIQTVPNDKYFQIVIVTELG